MDIRIPLIIIFVVVSAVCMAQEETDEPTLTRIGVVQTDAPTIETDDETVNPYSDSFDAEKVNRELKRPRVEHYCERLRRAGENDCDIVVLTEDTQGIGRWVFCGDRPQVQQALAEPVPGPTTDAYAAIAREYQMYVVAGVMERDGDTIYNTAVLIDREGEIAGRYRKTHLPNIERGGVTPGDGFPVFETDFGRVGMLICYDWIFPEAMACIACQGADLVCVPTMAYGWTEELGEATIKCRAGDHSINVAMSIYPRENGPGRSAVVTRGGQIVADAGYRMDTVVYADIDISAYRHDKFVSDPETSDLGGRLYIDRMPGLYDVLTEKRTPAWQIHNSKGHIRGRNEPENIMERVHEMWNKDEL